MKADEAMTAKPTDKRGVGEAYDLATNAMSNPNGPSRGGEADQTDNRAKRGLSKYQNMVARRREKGLCLRCGSEELAEGTQMCVQCRDKHREWMKKVNKRVTEKRRASKLMSGVDTNDRGVVE